MSDQCRFCQIQGDIEACEAVSCTHHESWYAQRYKNLSEKYLEQILELKEEIEIHENTANGG